MIETKIDVKTLAEKGLFLQERLTRNGTDIQFLTNDDSKRLMSERFDLWQKKAGGNGGELAFKKRLAIENLPPEQLKEKLGAVSWKNEASLPNWVHMTEEILSILPTTIESMEESMHFKVRKDVLEKEVDTYQILLPFLYYAENEVLNKLGKNRILISDVAMVQFLEELAKSLHILFYQTCTVEFRAYVSEKNPILLLLGNKLSKGEQQKAWDQYVDKLLAGEWMELIMKYPVLARIMCVTINYWVQNIAAFVQHLHDDYNELQIVFNDGKKLGQLTNVEADISDVHNQGKSVFILTFSSDAKVVYKPRSLKIDQSWRKWLKYLEDEGLPYPIITPKVIDRHHYGWMEFIEHKPLANIEEAHAFYFRAGVLLGIVYAFGGNDFHYENVIACGAHPVLVDTETLLLHKVRPFESDERKRSASQIADDMMSDSVVRTGLLPMWRTNKQGKAVDWGALTAKVGEKLNVPFYQNETLDVTEYEADLIAGVEWVYSFVAKNKQKLIGDQSPIDALFGDCQFRFLIRSSQIYGDMLTHTVKPQYLQDGILYSFEIERLAAAFLLYASNNNLKKLWNLFVSERDALENRDIPIFYGKAKEITVRDGSKALYDQYFMESALSNAKSLMKQMGEEDKKFQINLIKLSLSMQSATSHTSGDTLSAKATNITKLQVDDRILLEEAKEIYDEIMKHRIKASDQDFTWLARQFDLQTEKMTVGQIGISFYDGVIGIGLFMAALYAITKDENVKQSALATIRSIRSSLYDSYNPFPIHRFPIGIGSGVAGVIRGFTMMSHYLHDESLLNDARMIARQIRKSQITEDKSLDILGGSAGLIVVLVDLYKRTNEDDILSLAHIAGDHLLDHRTLDKSGHRVWKIGIEKEPLTGFGHGAAGYAYALYKLSKINKESKFAEAAFEALEYENSLYNEQYNNWPDLRKNPFELDRNKLAFMEGWCSGAPGIGLARIGMMQDSYKEDTTKFIEDIEKAIRFANELSDLRSDHVCCGHAGSIEFLIEASMTLQRPQLLEVAKEKLGMILGRKRNNNHYLLNSEDSGVIFNPAFFQGISGIGYQILRCIRPDEIVSVMK